MITERDSIIHALKVASELLTRKASGSFKSFVRYIQDDYDMRWFHAVICDHLDRFDRGEIKKLMILLPPQHGKSQLATRLFPPYLLGRNPDRRIAIASYAQNIASGFNRSIQRFIDNEDYAKIFPATKLNYSKIFKTNFDNYTRNEHKFEVVGKRGSVKTVGRGGPLTSEPVDVGIIDDLYKDRAEAKSMAVSQSAWEWYTDVFKTRMHNDSQQLIMNTRWDENDLCGRLLQDEPDEWNVIMFPAIKTTDVNEYDPRKEGEALWPDRHSLERILEVKRQSQVTFNSLYQQDPKPNTDLLVYPKVTIIPEFPQLEVVYWGLDFGFTNDPTVLVKCGTLGNDSFFRECCYSPGIPMKYIKEKLIENGYKEGQPVWCDHVPTYIAELRTLGIAAFPAVKGEGSLQAGIQKMREYNIHITEDSHNFKREANQYQWVTYGNIITNEPVDEDNHAWDAARYGHYSKHFR